ncbi:MAG: class III poly(R)-hydroxyalkanoic acid synthase subunit PhaC [Povalibacter sp.]
MSGTPFDQLHFASEAEEFAQRVSRGLGALARIGEVEIGTAAKDAIHSEDKLVLYRYRTPEGLAANAQVRVPLLICYALVNRPYMMDLQPDRSLIRGLLNQGIDVYLIDWGYPDGADRYLTLNDYVNRYLHNCVEAIRKDAGQEQVNVLGVCQGGTLSLCYAALHPERIRNLITMVTPVDFRTPENLLTKWSEHIDLDALVATLGNVPGSMLNALFVGMQPFRLTSQKYVDLFDHVDNQRMLETFLRMEKWIFDSPDQPGEMFRQFMTWLVKENRLVKGTLELDGRAVKLDEIRSPLLNIYASQDHLVPPSASTPLERLTRSADYSSYAFPGGHIGIYVSAAAQREVPVRIANWLRARDSSWADCAGL